MHGRKLTQHCGQRQGAAHVPLPLLLPIQCHKINRERVFVLACLGERTIRETYSFDSFEFSFGLR
jgi:hypothetical protein